jgi:hypothetical protein
MDRDAMIEALVLDALLRATEGRGLDRLADILQGGFSGYEAFTDEQLREAIEIHGLAPLQADADDEDQSSCDSEDLSGLRSYSIADEDAGY